ncbi:unnamed protein product, partial [Ectocarpus sp. 6 AP-2014]
MSGGLTNYPSGDYNELHRAVAEGRIKKILARLGLGVDDINAPSKTKGETPLTIASAHGYDRVTTLLLDRGADTERVTPSRGWTALFFSIPYPDVTRVLLERGANHGAISLCGSTPLHFAIRGEIGDACLEVAEILLEFGADANAKDNQKQSPLHLLAHKGRPAKGRVEAAKLLVKFRANIDAMDIKGCTPLMNTCGYVTGLVALAEMLVAESASLDAQNMFGSTPLHLLASGDKVCGNELLEIAKLLIEKGANIEAIDRNGSTPLHLASMFVGNIGLVKLLLDRGADPAARDITGETPLHLAGIAGSFCTMSVLIAAGAKVNPRDQRGETPLFKAASRGHLVAVKVLLHAKASALLPSSDGDAIIYPLEIAAALGHTDIVGELVQRVGVDGCGGPSGGAHALALAAKDKRVDVMLILLKTGVVDTGEALSETVNEFACMKSLVQHRLGDSDYLDRYGRCAESMKGGGEQATSDQLNMMRAVQRLLLRAEAVTAISWLWSTGTDAAAPTTKTATAATPALTAMMPLLRRRAVRRGFALHAMLR